MRRNTWPGFALAGGVIIAALLALLLIGGGGAPGGAGLPNLSPPSSTLLVPAQSDLAGDEHSTAVHRRAEHHQPRSAGGAQYGVGTGAGPVLGAPSQPR